MGSKKERLAAFNKGNILGTAERLFAEKGFGETTMDDISKAADCSKSTIYVYFRSKEEIYNHIILSHMEDLRDVAIACMERGSGFEESYFQICNILAKTYEEQKLYFESMMGKISIDEAELAENEVLAKIYEVGESINDSMIRLFERGIEEGALREDIEILPAIHTLWASLANTIVLAHNKEAYFKKRLGMDKGVFMDYGFGLLLLTIKRQG